MSRRRMLRVFQSTLPARGATSLCPGYHLPHSTFQSTLPARGATIPDSTALNVVAISIHAPRTGSDQRLYNAFADRGISIHAPRTGSDTNCGEHSPHIYAISIHAPRTGSDFMHSFGSFISCISIHAPRTGSDHISRYKRYSRYISIHAPRTGSDSMLRGTNSS